MPTLAERRDVVQEHYDGMLSHYGGELGVRCARKHLGWYVEEVADLGVVLSPDEAKAWRRRLCQQDDAAVVKREIDAFYGQAGDRAAA